MLYCESLEHMKHAEPVSAETLRKCKTRSCSYGWFAQDSYYMNVTMALSSVSSVVMNVPEICTVKQMAISLRPPVMNAGMFNISLRDNLSKHIHPELLH